LILNNTNFKLFKTKLFKDNFINNTMEDKPQKKIMIKVESPIKIVKRKKHKIEKDDKPPNLISNSIYMFDLNRTHYDKYNLTHIRYLLSLSDNEWKNNFEKKYAPKEVKAKLTQFRNLLSNILEEGNEEVKRYYSVGSCNRLQAKGGGIQYLETNLRNFIQCEGMKDYDIVNAQVSILLYLTKKLDLPHSRLQYYCENVDAIRKKYGKKKVKDAVLFSMFSDNPKPTKMLEVDGLVQEMIDNRDLIIHSYKDCIHPDKPENPTNPKGSNMSSILCYYEGVIVNSVVSQFGDKVNTLMFDGFNSTFDIPIEKLNSITKEYGVKWIQKPMETCYELPDDFNESEVLTYKEQKAKFEKEVCFVTFAENYKVRDDIDGTWKSMTTKGIKEKYKNWRTINKLGEEIDFMDRWLKDEKRTDYNRMIFHPYSLDEYNSTHKKEFNTFTGFKAKQLDRHIEDSEVEKFTQHLKICFGWEEGKGDEIVKFLIKHIAHIIKKPHQKVEGILVIRGFEGTGKDTVKEIFKRFMGKDYVYECKGMKEIITDGAWNDHLLNKLLVVMNEVTGEDGVKNLEGLKHKATSFDLNVREKFMKNQTIKDMNNMIINSNNNCPIIISPTDRRYCLLVTNEDIAKDESYWTPFYQYLDDADEMNKVYTWLLQQDIEDYDFQHDRVITEAYKKLASKNISEAYLVLYKFLKDWIESPDYKQWLKNDKVIPWKMLSSKFNTHCFNLSKYILERRYTIKKSTVKEKMENIPTKYIELKADTVGEFKGQMTWIVKNPEALLKRLEKLEFQYFDPNSVDLTALDNSESDFEDDF